MLQKPLTPAFHKSTITRERKKQDFEVQREKKNKKLNTFFLSEESITLVGKTNPTQQKFNLQNLKAKIFTAKCG